MLVYVHNLPGCLWVAWWGSSEAELHWRSWFYSQAIWYWTHEIVSEDLCSLSEATGASLMTQGPWERHMDTTKKTPNMIPAFSGSNRWLQESTWCHCRVPTNRRKRGSAEGINVPWMTRSATNYQLSVLLGWHSGCLNFVILMSTTSNFEDGHGLSRRAVDLQHELRFQHTLFCDMWAPASSKAISLSDRHLFLHSWNMVLALLALLTPLMTATGA